MSGSIEILRYEGGEAGVMIWDRHKDSGWQAETFQDTQRAIDFANGYAAATGLEIEGGDVVDLFGREA